MITSIFTGEDDDMYDVMPDNDVESAQRWLKLAYLQLSAGALDEARESCIEACVCAPDHPTPEGVMAAIDIARGDLRAALKRARQTSRKWPDAAIGHVYLAEANFLTGRSRLAERALSNARQADDFEAWREHVEQLELLWESLAEQSA